jgi:methionyl-tRNA formyltransferase
MGTPDFAAASLGRLFSDGHEIPLVLTQPDKPKNRGQKLQKSPVKLLAEGKTDIYQPDSLRSGEAERIIRAAAPELIAVVAYGKLLPEEILNIPGLGCVNLHGSLLPKYRGAAPIQRAVLAGEKTVGVTSMYMARELDAGDMIFAEATPLGENETSGELLERAAILGADVLSRTVTAIARGDAPRTAQNHAQATFAPPLSKAESRVDWTKRAQAVHNQIRGLNPWPCAVAELDGELFRLHMSKLAEGAGAPGEIIARDNAGFTVACAEGAVKITRLQASGGKIMDAGAYMRGHAGFPVTVR